MNIVYFLVNNTRLAKKAPPYYYIGSKTDCSVVSGVIVDKKGKEYWSSSKSVKESIIKGDNWCLSHYYESEFDYLECESDDQERVNAKSNPEYFNKSHANKRFNSSIKGVGESISKAKTGKVKPFMLDKKHWSHLHSKDSINKSSKSRINNPKVKEAARKRNAKWAECPEYRKRRSEISRKANVGRKLTDHEIWLRKHDDRYKPNRKLTNQQVFDIRFGLDKNLTLDELCVKYNNVTKATLSRVRRFKVFKDINEDWSNAT